MSHTPEELLTVEEVAAYLRTTTNTVYRWCRSGKLPARRIAKEWRINAAELDQALTGHRIPESRLLGQTLAKGLRSRDHVVVITRSPDEVYELESTFFNVAVARGGKLFKGCWWQHPDDVRQRLTQGGLPVAELESSGRLVIADLTAAFRREGVDGAVASWTTVAREAAASGAGSVWGSGSPHQEYCGGDRGGLLAFEEALNQALAKYSVVAICPYYFCDDELAADTLVELAQRHSAMLIYNLGRSVLLRRA